MTALELLDTLANIGIAAVLEDSKLYLQPGDKVTPDLMDEARAHKGELVAALSNRRVPPETGLAPLLERLRDGQAWLVAGYDDYMDGTGSEPQYVSGLVQWDVLERLLRRLYGYSGCPISESGCDPDSPVICTTCAEARDREEAT